MSNHAHFDRRLKRHRRQATGTAKAALQSIWETQHCLSTVEAGKSVFKCVPMTLNPTPTAAGDAQTAATPTPTANEVTLSDGSVETMGSESGAESGAAADSSGDSSSDGSDSSGSNGGTDGSSNGSSGSDSSSGSDGSSGSGSSGGSNGSSGSDSSGGSSDPSNDGSSSDSGSGNASDGSSASADSGADPTDGGDSGADGSSATVPATATASADFGSSSVLFAVPSGTGSLPLVPLTDSLGSTTGYSTDLLASTSSATALAQTANNPPTTRSLAATVAPAVVGSVLGLIVLALAVFCGFSYRRRKQQAELDAIGFGYTSGAALAQTPSPRFKGRPGEFLTNLRSTALGFLPSMKRKNNAADAAGDDSMQEADLQHRPSISPFAAGYGPGAQALAAGLAGAGSPPRGPRPMSEAHDDNQNLRVVHLGDGRGDPSGDNHSAYESAVDPADSHSYSSWQRNQSQEGLASPTSEAIDTQAARSTLKGRWW